LPEEQDWRDIAVSHRERNSSCACADRYAMGDFVTVQNSIQGFVSAGSQPCENLDLTLGQCSRPGMPPPHEKTVDITKSLACFGLLPLFSSNQSLLPFSQDTLRRHISLFGYSRLGSLLRCPSPEHRQTHSSAN
jgi:hypothetical protein